MDKHVYLVSRPDQNKNRNLAPVELLLIEYFKLIKLIEIQPLEEEARAQGLHREESIEVLDAYEHNNPPQDELEDAALCPCKPEVVQAEIDQEDVEQSHI